MNYGETIAYWYLRLNGFFPLANFVLHRADGTVANSADTDLLAIRHPHVYEKIGGESEDWDDDFFTKSKLDLKKEIIAAIVEVKTGQDVSEVIDGVKRAFHPDRLNYAILRLGIWPSEKSGEITTRLIDAPLDRPADSNAAIIKILITDQALHADKIPPCLILNLNDANNFIVSRMASYMKQKFSDRRFFPSDLMQYIIWQQTKK